MSNQYLIFMTSDTRLLFTLFIANGKSTQIFILNNSSDTTVVKNYVTSKRVTYGKQHFEMLLGNKLRYLQLLNHWELSYPISCHR